MSKQKNGLNYEYEAGDASPASRNRRRLSLFLCDWHESLSARSQQWRIPLDDAERELGPRNFREKTAERN
jgi:hypothetical protein